MTRWYRAYEGTVTDPKLGEVALVAGCSKSVAIAAWHCILESCAVANNGGNFDATLRRVAVILGEPLQIIEAVFSELENLKMIEGSRVSAWAKRQFESDNSTERSKKHRQIKKQQNATLQGRDATPPYTDTDTDTEVEKKEPREVAIAVLPIDGKRVKAKIAAEDFARFWEAYPHKVGKPDAARGFLKVASEVEAILEGLERYKLAKPADRSWLNPSTFINQRRWEDRPAQNAGAQNGRQGNSVSAAADALVGIFEGRASGRSREEGEAHVRMLPAR